MAAPKHDEDYRLITEIAYRAAEIYRRWDREVQPVQIRIDLAICHRHVVPLRLNDMLNGKAHDLIHDVAGINRHLDRKHPPKLNDCFLPRYADTTALAKPKVSDPAQTVNEHETTPNSGFQQQRT